MKKTIAPFQPAARDVLTSTLPFPPLPMVRLVPIWLSVETVAKPMLQTLPAVNSGSIVLIGHGCPQEEEVDFFDFEEMLADDAEMMAWEKDSEEDEIEMVE